jgi:pimeloyl-ACP methyl ester carboxylesterase
MTHDPRSVMTRPAPEPDRAVRYGPHPDQVADLRLPPAGTGPLVIVVHGGFWRPEYDRAHAGPMAAAIAALGHPVAQVEYRRTGYPDTLDDVAAGVAALPALAVRAAADLGRPAPAGPPVLIGHSAGGHLALWYAATHPALTGVIALAPVADLAEAYRLDLDGGAVAALLGGGPDRVPDRYDRADPARLPAPACPVVVLHGDRDAQVPVDIGRRYAARIGARLVELPGVEHFGLIDPESPAWRYVTNELLSLFQ